MPVQYFHEPLHAKHGDHEYLGEPADCKGVGINNRQGLTKGRHGGYLFPEVPSATNLVGEPEVHVYNVNPTRPVAGGKDDPSLPLTRNLLENAVIHQVRDEEEGEEIHRIVQSFVNIVVAFGLVSRNAGPEDLQNDPWANLRMGYNTCKRSFPNM